MAHYMAWSGAGETILAEKEQENVGSRKQKATFGGTEALPSMEPAVKYVSEKRMRIERKVCPS